DLTLTSKSSGDNSKAPMCGIPYHAVETYINKLIALGYKIAICEQMQQAGKGVKLVRRDVVRVITPGTVIDEGTIEENRNNYIVSIFQQDKTAGVSYCEITTGEFGIAQFDGDYIGELNDFLVRISPSEIICHKEADLDDLIPCVKSGMMPKFLDYDPYKFSKTFSTEIMEKYFGIQFESIYELKNKKEAQFSAGALLGYLEETQKRVLSHINRIKVENQNDFMHLDVNTRRNLEIIETLKDRRKKGALLSVIDKTKTAMGARLIKKWIQEPLCNEKEINLRLDAVEELVKKLIFRDSLRDTLNGFSDIERICGRIAYGNFTPKDADLLRKSLSYIPNLKQTLSNFETEKLKTFCNSLPNFEGITSLLFNAFRDDCPAILSNGNFIRDGFSKELDELRNAKTNNQEYISKLEQEERKASGISSLRIAYNRVIGYFIEIDTSLSGLVPLRYTRKQTVANKDRYITEELKNYQNLIESADEESLKLERMLFNQIREHLLKSCIDFQKSAKIIAELDCLLSFADVAVKNNYVKPKVSSRISHILIENGRHPVIEDINKKEQFIPNDTLLDCDKNKIMIITGPNMAGKSTYMRQVATITLLSHIGCFVPASRAEISLTDRIFTRVGASDDLTIGQSTFMVEMMEVANILKNATKKSLVVLDEIGRGTSTFDGLSIAWAVIEEISNNMQCKTMFSTHYHELTELEGLLPGIKNYKIAIKELNGKLVYLRKIQRGGANRSYGIEVAELAGVLPRVINRAKEISKELERNDLSRHIISSSPIEQVEVENKSKNHNEIVSILSDIDVNKMTPLGAFDTLCDLVSKAKKG
ncbi:MAG: DNA mismatch repair protein MutS, partial [Clostridia bacterium]|nr:DNA mismatch repair protein MutS [Clostridia bacterium]